LKRYLDEYIAAAGIADDADGPSVSHVRAQDRPGASHVAAERLPDDPAPSRQCQREDPDWHSHLPGHGHHRLSEKRRAFEHAPQIANHFSPRTTKLYDRRTDEISLDGERIVI